MTTKEKNDHLVDKWLFMVSDLSDKKSYQTRFAKLFENTTLKSETKYLKIVIPILQKFLYRNPDVKLSSSSRNSLHISSINKSEIIDNNIIMPDFAIAFVESCSKSLQDNFDSNTLEKINCLQISNSGRQIHVSALY